MKTVSTLHPNNLNVSAQDRIIKLEIAVLILRDHLEQFGDQIRLESIENYTFIRKNLDYLIRELNIRKWYPVSNKNN